MTIIGAYKKVWEIIDTRSKWRLAFLSPLPIIGSLVELISTLVIFNLIVVVLNSPESAPSLEVFDKYTWLAWLRDQGDYFAIFAVAVAAVGRNVFRLGNLYVTALVIENTVGIAKMKLYKQYLLSPLVFHTQSVSSDLVRNLWTQLEGIIRGPIQTLLSAISNVFMMVALMIPILAVSPDSLVFLLAFIGILSWGLLRTMKRLQVNWGTLWHQVIGEMLNLIQQSFGGIREVKVYQREEYFLSKYNSAEKRYERYRRFQGVIATTPGVMLDTLLMVGMCTVLVWLLSRGLDLVAMGPVLGLVAYSSLRILPMVNQLIAQVGSLRNLHTAIGDVCNDFHRTNEALEQAKLYSRPVETSEIQEITDPVTLELKNVTYNYSSDSTAGIAHASFRVEGGSSVAIIGPTGAGKSTLLNLILGFVSPDSGEITVNRFDLRFHLDQWLSRIGFVAQEPFILTASIKDNIAFAVDSADISEALLRDSINAAQLSSWIETLPLGVNTIVGERGSQVSGGQRQRIAIARALYRLPSVLIMDEPTSAIDSRTERALESAILGMPGKITRILVTHRLDTARLCDQVVFVENGKVEGVGSFDELRDTNVMFKTFLKNAAAEPLLAKK